jgi:hypothetical protein
MAKYESDENDRRESMNYLLYSERSMEYNQEKEENDLKDL